MSNVDYSISGELRDYCSTKSECRKLARMIRAEAGAAANTPIVVVTEDLTPELKGKSCRHVNKSGAVVKYPNAYRRAFGKPIYVPSSLHVEVGHRFVVWAYSLLNDMAYELSV